jgi:hypothetical protein
VSIILGNYCIATARAVRTFLIAQTLDFMASSFFLCAFVPLWLINSSFFLLPSSFFLLPSSFFLLPSSFFLLASSFLPLPSSFFLFPSSFFLLPSSFFLLPSSFFLLPSSFCYTCSRYRLMSSIRRVNSAWVLMRMRSSRRVIHTLAAKGLAQILGLQKISKKISPV